MSQILCSKQYPTCPKNEYCDYVIGFCSTCSFICSPARGMMEHCNKHCPDYLYNQRITTTLKTDPPHTTKINAIGKLSTLGFTTIPALNPISSFNHIWIIVIIIVVLVVLIIILILILFCVKRRQKNRQKQNYEVTDQEFQGGFLENNDYVGDEMQETTMSPESHFPLTSNTDVTVEGSEIYSHVRNGDIADNHTSVYTGTTQSMEIPSNVSRRYANVSRSSTLPAATPIYASVDKPMGNTLRPCSYKSAKNGSCASRLVSTASQTQISVNVPSLCNGNCTELAVHNNHAKGSISRSTSKSSKLNKSKEPVSSRSSHRMKHSTRTLPCGNHLATVSGTLCSRNHQDKLLAHPMCHRSKSSGNVDSVKASDGRPRDHD